MGDGRRGARRTRGGDAYRASLIASPWALCGGRALDFRARFIYFRRLPLATILVRSARFACRQDGFLDSRVFAPRLAQHFGHFPRRYATRVVLCRDGHARLATGTNIDAVRFTILPRMTSLARHLAYAGERAPGVDDTEGDVVIYTIYRARTHAFICGRRFFTFQDITGRGTFAILR